MDSFPFLQLYIVSDMGRWLVESSLRHGSGNLGPHACLPHKDTQLSARKSAVIMCAKSQSHSVTNGLGTGTSWSTCIGQCLWLKCTMTYGNSALYHGGCGGSRKCECSCQSPLHMRTGAVFVWTRLLCLQLFVVVSVDTSLLRLHDTIFYERKLEGFIISKNHFSKII